MDTVRYEVHRQPANFFNNPSRCPDCDVELNWQNYSNEQPRRCKECEAKVVAARSVPCLYCDEPADPLNGGTFEGKPLHYSCRLKIDRTSPLTEIVARRWGQVNWRRQELVFVLACGHSHWATREQAKTMRCTTCGRAAVLNQPNV